MHREIMTEMSESIKEILDCVIPYASVIEKMGIYREPVLVYSAKSPAALAYENLWQEISSII